MTKTNTELLFSHDKLFGNITIAGVDEAGRGPLCGPVVCAACIMPLESMIDKINDSKTLSQLQRERLFEEITKRAVCYNISVVDHDTIDRINILEATKLGMKNAIEGLKTKPDKVLVDFVKGLDIRIPFVPIVKGDATSYNIAAASILAKVTRDRYMAELALKYPGYGFETNKGYGTKEHMAALLKLGKTPYHRESFLKKLDL